jgi:hypothetical protein
MLQYVLIFISLKLGTSVYVLYPGPIIGLCLVESCRKRCGRKDAIQGDGISQGNRPTEATGVVSSQPDPTNIMDTGPKHA